MFAPRLPPLLTLLPATSPRLGSFSQVRIPMCWLPSESARYPFTAPHSGSAHPRSKPTNFADTGTSVASRARSIVSFKRITNQ